MCRQFSHNSPMSKNYPKSAPQNLCVFLGHGAPPFLSLAVKEVCFVPRGKCGGFFVKFLAATFPGNWRAKICKHFRQIFAAFFARVCEKFRLHFALRKFLHCVFWDRDRNFDRAIRCIERNTKGDWAHDIWGNIWQSRSHMSSASRVQRARCTLLSSGKKRRWPQAVAYVQT